MTNRFERYLLDSCRDSPTNQADGQAQLERCGGWRKLASLVSSWITLSHQRTTRCDEVCPQEATHQIFVQNSGGRALPIIPVLSHEELNTGTDFFEKRGESDHLLLPCWWVSVGERLISGCFLSVFQEQVSSASTLIQLVRYPVTGLCFIKSRGTPAAHFRVTPDLSWLRAPVIHVSFSSRCRFFDIVSDKTASNCVGGPLNQCTR